MEVTKTWLSPNKAAALVGCSGRHLTNLIHKGKISATKEDGKFKIDPAELFRVFPESHRKQAEMSQISEHISSSQLASENGMLKEMTNAKDREIEFLRAQIESLNKQNQQLVNSITSHTQLLEHSGSKGKRKGWLDRLTGKR